MAVVFRQEENGAYAGCYDLFFIIDNGNPCQCSAPDQMNNMLPTVPSLDFVFPGYGTIEDLYAISPNKLISTLEILNCDKGNVAIE